MEVLYQSRRCYISQLYHFLAFISASCWSGVCWCPVFTDFSDSFLNTSDHSVLRCMPAALRSFTAVPVPYGIVQSPLFPYFRSSRSCYNFSPTVFSVLRLWTCFSFGVLCFTYSVSLQVSLFYPCSILSDAIDVGLGLIVDVHTSRT